MTQEEKLKTLIQRAIQDGYKPKDPLEKGLVEFVLGHIYSGEWSAIHVLMNHDFARALFGEEDERFMPEQINPDIGGHFDPYEQPPLLSYKKHLMLAVASDDPIDYMYTAVFGE